jgi:hypothetical protein
METQSIHFLDRRRARALAGFIALAALIAMAQIWLSASRIDPLGKPMTAAAEALSDPAVNAAFLRCKAERGADVDRLLADGLINAAQHAQYRERAVSTCAGQFPPAKAE